ncbi:MAG: FecCD family ABC transporter permease, partial [Candidatus Limnocylindria bacterium]
MQRVLVLRLVRPAISLRVGLGSVVVLLAAVAGSIGFFAVGVGSGDFPLTLAEVLTILAGGGDETSRFVVWTLRLPRLLDAVLVGAALAVSGAIFQALTRNPLVAPDIIGVNGGAALAAVALIILGGPAALIAPTAFAGGLAAAIVVYVLAWRHGLSSYRLVLVGIGVSAVATAGIGFLLTRGEIWEVQRATIWLIGSLYATDWGDVALMAGTLAVLLPVTFLLGRELGVLQLGDDAAAGMGVRVEYTRLLLVVVAVGLAAISVTVAGPIAFVAFIAPHLARRLARTSGASVIPAAAAIGALLTIAADIVARRIVDPAELPVGILTVLLGAPYFLWLLARASRLG